MKFIDLIHVEDDDSNYAANRNTIAISSSATTTLTMAGTGALIGSIAPGVGTIVGLVIGTIIGITTGTGVGISTNNVIENRVNNWIESLK